MIGCLILFQFRLAHLVFVEQLLERGVELLGRMALEGRDADVADPVLRIDQVIPFPVLIAGKAADRTDGHQPAGQSLGQRLAGRGAEQRERDAGAGLAADQRDRLGQRQVVGFLPVDGHDPVAGPQTGIEGRAAFNRTDDDHAAGGQRADLDADALKPSFRVVLKLLIFLAVEVFTVRIEAVEHAVDGTVQQHLGIDLLDVVLANLVLHIEQRSELIEQRIPADKGLRHLPQQHCDDGADGDPDQVAFRH